MSRTRPARSWKSADSRSGLPNSFTSRAPETLKRSVMLLFIEASSWNDSRVSFCIPRPTRLAGMMNVGTMTRAMSVSRHSRPIITARVTTTSKTFCTTVPRVPVNACWAPSTSLFMRLMRAPVCVRVKKARGMRWTWSYNDERRSKMRPFADPGRQPPLDDPHPGVGHGQHQGQERQPVDAPEVAPGDGVVVDDPPEDEGGQDLDERRHQDGAQQPGQEQAVGLGEPPHPPHDGAVEGAVDQQIGVADPVVAESEVAHGARQATAWPPLPDRVKVSLGGGGRLRAPGGRLLAVAVTVPPASPPTPSCRYLRPTAGPAARGRGCGPRPRAPARSPGGGSDGG